MNNYIFYSYYIYKKINEFIIMNKKNKNKNYVYTDNFYKKKLKFDQMIKNRIV